MRFGRRKVEEGVYASYIVEEEEMKREPRDPDEIRIQKVVNGYILTIFIDPYDPASSAVRDSVVQVAETFDSLTSKLRFLFGAQDDVSPIR